MFGLDFGALVGGSALLTEVGVRSQRRGAPHLSGASQSRLPMILGSVMYASFFVVLANAVVDIVYVLIDPRVRGS